MPRGPRDDAPGVAHHVMVRGIERRALFMDDVDRRELLRRLSVLVPELGFRCFAWALMPNHFHLVVRSGPVRVSRLMARLGTGYARYFNRRHDRVGHLLQNRFRSRRVVDDADLLGLVLYVSRNPLEGDLVTDPRGIERLRWCGVGALLGWRRPHAFEAVAETLALFDDDRARAQGRIRAWLAEAAEERAAPELPPARRDSSMRARAGASGAGTRTCADAAALLREVCLRFGVSERELHSMRRGRALAAARAEFARRAARELGLAGPEIGRAIGVTPAGVSRIFARTRPEPSPSQSSQ